MKQANLLIVVLPFVILFLAISFVVGYCGYQYADAKPTVYTHKATIKLMDEVIKNGFNGVTVKLVNDPERQAYYSSKTQEININESVYYYHKNFLIHTLFHEYGHHIWWILMTELQSETYKTIYLSEPEYVSKYAMTNGLSEDFAETFRCYMTKDCPLPSQREKFMDEVVYPIYMKQTKEVLMN